MSVGLYKRVGVFLAVALISVLAYQSLRLKREELDINLKQSHQYPATPIPAPKDESTENDPASPILSTEPKPSDQANTLHPLDSVLEIAKQSLDRLKKDIDDYSGIIVKRERIQGALGDETKMEFKIRSRREINGKVRPLSVYLKFLEPRSAKNREVIWTEGKKLIGHEGGFANLVRLELEPTGMLAMMGNKYPITEIGLSKLVEKLIEKGERDRALGACEVVIKENQVVGDRSCRMIQVTHPVPNGKFDYHIAQIYIDTERMIPLKYAAYLWPKSPQEPPPLEEEFTYLDLKLNVGLQDSDFDPDNKAYNYP